MGNKKFNKFKLTPEKYREFKILAAELGPFQRKDKMGNPLFRKITKFVGTIEEKGKTYNRCEVIKDPILVNHEINLRTLYQKAGQEQVDKYVASFRTLKIELDEEEKQRESKKSEPQPQGEAMES